ncbi:hypothetical protein NCY64_15265 [Phocaeicola vulgatus]|nr:hypothetical protein [Phocaeicola vulgatus]MCM1724703.1 hypothetical protein [Phocaeicola vulgatus]MCM1737880.1 hypothetical protein [Phocaeicola vulgatus]MCM1765772.1 hypothetical protein [Phocaeicola vulgatus]MCM1782371.1 hypothetical protein [Phocaeicola vulgatus]MCM1905089.1 hypothetical protein [Phocaeicola vulgatus]
MNTLMSMSIGHCSIMETLNCCNASSFPYDSTTVRQYDSESVSLYVSGAS